MSFLISPLTRRHFLKTGLAGAAVASTASLSAAPQDELPRHPEGVEVLFPRKRVPVSFIIDDSTCLVNMGHFCMPQFAACYPERASYQKPWRDWPREIPDSFVREFGEWCAGQGVKGKYSIVPYPACVGWVDRLLPGWSREELQASLKLVRELMLPNWDIHPEMISHTRVIDLKTGRPLREISPATMENSYPQEDKSVDELAAYLAYALGILKNCDLPCEGITTPGGFGNRVKEKLPLAVHEAVRDVYQADLPHYFKYIFEGEKTEPVLEGLRYVDGHPEVTVNVPAATGDWFGGWDGVRTPEPDRYANKAASAGRMVEQIERGQPAVFLCHWPGMYCNGSKAGFHAFQQVVTTIGTQFRDRILWMKVSEIARYWAAKKLTKITRTAGGWKLQAPYSSDNFTLRLPARGTAKLINKDAVREFESVRTVSALRPGTVFQQGEETVLCFDLPKGESELVVS